MDGQLQYVDEEAHSLIAYPPLDYVEFMRIFPTGRSSCSDLQNRLLVTQDAHQRYVPVLMHARARYLANMALNIRSGQPPRL